MRLGELDWELKTVRLSGRMNARSTSIVPFRTTWTWLRLQSPPALKSRPCKSMHLEGNFSGSVPTRTLSVISNGFDRTVLHGLIALLKFILIFRLLVANVVILIVAHTEVPRSCIGTNGTQNALHIDIERHFFPPISAEPPILSSQIFSRSGIDSSPWLNPSYLMSPCRRDRCVQIRNDVPMGKFSHNVRSLASDPHPSPEYNMAILKVARMGHPVLRATAEAIPPEEITSAPVQQLIEDMLDTCEEYDGIGLAAPQVHFSVQVVILEIDDQGPTVWINPKLTPLTDRTHLHLRRMSLSPRAPGNGGTTRIDQSRSPRSQWQRHRNGSSRLSCRGRST